MSYRFQQRHLMKNINNLLGNNSTYCFDAGENNIATEKFAELISENKDASLKLICEYFIEAFKKDERMCVKYLHF